MAKKTKKKSSGMRLPGGIGPKAVLAGIGAMLITPRIIPVATPGQTKLAAGMGLRFLKIGGGGALAAVGIMETVAEMMLPRLGGFVPGVPGGNQTGYDY